jgi:hypothetical protein
MTDSNAPIRPQEGPETPEAISAQPEAKRHRGVKLATPAPQRDYSKTYQMKPERDPATDCQYHAEKTHKLAGAALRWVRDEVTDPKIRGILTDKLSDIFTESSNTTTAAQKIV